MTATAAPTDTQSDPREVPGGGKRKPVRHRVRIVVVPLSSDNESLAAAAQILKEMPPPASDGTSGQAGSSDATPTNPSNMFEALKPTDIVVVGRRPTSVRRIGSEDGKFKRELAEHDHSHTDTVLRVWTESDTIQYLCDEPFEITRMERAGWKIYGTPEDPFSNEKPYLAQQRGRDASGKPFWEWTSSRLPATANNQQYKATFKIGDQLIDPDVVCGDPPPAP